MSVANTLEDLNLEWDANYYGEQDEESVFSAVVNLKALKRLTVSLHDLVGRSPPGVVDLADMLPPNLEQLWLPRIYDQWHCADYIQCVEKLLRARRDRPNTLSKLRRIEMDDDILNPLIEFGQEVGIEVV